MLGCLGQVIQFCHISSWMEVADCAQVLGDLEAPFSEPRDVWSS